MKIVYKIVGMIWIICSCSEDRIEIRETGNITGSVVVMGDNIPVANVKITTQPASSTVFTDEEGTFTIEDVLEEVYAIQAEKEGYLVDFESASVVANKSVNVVFELQSSLANNKPPSAPELIAPLTNQESVDVAVLLEWEAAIDADEADELYYKLTLYNDKNNDVLEIENIEETSVVVSDLLYDTKYFWNITVSDQVNTPVIGKTYNFRTVSPPENVYCAVRKIGANNVIFSLDENGNMFQLTSESHNSWRPRKNVITNKIAYLQTVGGEVHLFVMNNDGSDKKQITNTIPVNGFNLNEINIAWKPTGEAILYPSFDKVYKINTDGSGLSEFYQTSNGNFVSEIDWSATNDIIALKTNNVYGYNVEVFTVDVNGLQKDTVLSNVHGAVSGINLSSDGQQLLYSYDVSGAENISYAKHKSRMFVYDAAQQVATQIVTATPVGYNELDPRFSPNEDGLVFVQQGRATNAPKDIYIKIFDNAINLNAEKLFNNMEMIDWEN